MLQSVRVLLNTLTAFLFVATPSFEMSAKEEKKVSFHKEIRPIFQANCNGCHQPAKRKGDYMMTEFQSLLQGGETGEIAIVPGKPMLSYLVDQIKSDQDGFAEMPKGKNAKPLHAAEYNKIVRWIEEGAVNDSPDGLDSGYSMENLPTYEIPPLVLSLSYSPDGHHLAMTGFHEAIIRSANGGKLVSRLVGLSERVESVAFSPDGKSLALTGGQPGRMGEVQVWDWKTKKLKLSHSVTYDTLYGISWSPDGKSLGFGASDTSVRVIQSNDGRQISYMSGHDDWVRGTVFSEDGKSIFSVSRDKTVKQTDVETERFIGNVTTHTPGVLSGGQNSIAVRPGKKELLVGGADGKAKLFRQATKAAPAGGGNPNQIREFKSQLGRIFSVCFSPKGNLGFSGSSLDGKGEIICFEIDTGKELWRKKVSDSAIYSLASSPDGKTLASGGYDGYIRLHKVSSGEVFKKFASVPIIKKSTHENTFSLIGENPEDAVSKTETMVKESSVHNLVLLPRKVSILRSIDYTQLLLQGDLGGGRNADVTRIAKWTVTGGVGTVSKRGIFLPAQDGNGTILASLGGKEISVPVVVSGFGRKWTPDFIEDVNPIISKLGCNAGTCHGAKDGKNGFKLSLRGYDAVYDVRGFTDDMACRRVNVAAPESSLMLLKASGMVPHEGGQLTDSQSKYYQVIRAWIAGGACLDENGVRVRKVEMFPKDPVAEKIGSSQQMRVVATMENGMVRDVTREAFITSGNGEVAEHDDFGLLTTLRRGEAPILARYEGCYAATTLTVMGDREGFQWEAPPVHNQIDRLVAEKWKRMKILPSGISGDLDFLRRVYLDLTGLPPTAEEVLQFTELKQASKSKRDQLIDQLVGSEEFVEHWTNKWSDLLQVNGKFLGRAGATALRKWIHGEIEKNTPYDQFVRKVLTASGSNKENPPASYYKILRTPEDTMENTTHLFLATRFNCNKCHDHPFERWTQNQYYEMSAHFAQFKLEKDPSSGKSEIGKTAVEKGKPLYEIVKDVNAGEIRHERTGAVIAPNFPYHAKFKSKPTMSRRARLAQWMTSPDNAYFAKSYVNRIWGYLFGTGIIEPIDDIRAGNPPSNPLLLNYLEKELINSGFNVRHIIKLICKSRTYQLSVSTNKWNVDDEVNFSHATPRRLSAETLLDAVYQVTGSTSRFPGVPPGTRAASLPDVGIKLPDGFLGTFGRPARETSCECERNGELQLGPVMALVSGPTVNDAISDAGNDIAKLAKEQKNDRELVNRLFLRVLNRPAKKQEIDQCLALFSTKIEEDDKLLKKQLMEAENGVREKLDQMEKAREHAVGLAEKAHLKYKDKISGDVEKAQKERANRMQKAHKELAMFDQMLPGQAREWEKNQKAGKSAWHNLDMSNVSSKIAGIHFKKQRDGSVFVSGKNGKGSYLVQTQSELTKITGVRLEAIPDNRLPQKGPGRAGSGNFVLSELEVLAKPLSDLTKWEKVGDWKFDQGVEHGNWKTAAGGTFPETKAGGLFLVGTFKGAIPENGDFYHAGPFENSSFAQKVGPEGLRGFDANQTFRHRGKEVKWIRKPDWKEGKVYGSVFSGDNAINYIHKIINVKEDRVLPLSLGSDDGIKVFLNGKEVFSNNIGRAAAPDQEKIKLFLKKGRNYLLIKIHNGAGQSGFYFMPEMKSADMPSMSRVIKKKHGSFAIEVAAKSKVPGKVKVLWTSSKSPEYNSKQASSDQHIGSSGSWKTYRFDFTPDTDLTGLRIQSEKEIMIRSIKMYRNQAEFKLSFQNAQATFSQGGYSVATAVDGKTARNKNGWAISGQIGKPHFASFEVREDFAFWGGCTLLFTLKQEYSDNRHTLGRFRLAVTNAPRPVSYGVPQEIKDIFAVSDSNRTAEQRKKIIQAYKKSSPARIALVKSLTKASEALPADPQEVALRKLLEEARTPVPLPPEIVRLRRAVRLSEEQLIQKRVIGAQDLTWALINTPAFLFNR